MKFCFCLFLDEKKHKCLVCSKDRKRSEVIIFATRDYDFENEIIKSTFLKYGKKLVDSVCYVCEICYYSLWKQKGKEPKLHDVIDNNVYFCTCCHEERKSRKQVIYFKHKNYDFRNKIVLMALDEDIRCKKSAIKYICKVCHHDLHIKRGSFPKMPQKVVARQGKICSNCKMNGNKTHRIENNWNQIWNRMQGFKSFEMLEKYVEHLPEFPGISSLEGNKHLPSYKRDCLAHSLIPSDSPIEKEQALPMHTTGNGNCFVNSMSCLDMVMKIITLR